MAASDGFGTGCGAGCGVVVGILLALGALAAAGIAFIVLVASAAHH